LIAAHDINLNNQENQSQIQKSSFNRGTICLPIIAAIFYLSQMTKDKISGINNNNNRQLATRFKIKSALFPYNLAE
jgi:hypothetical protein